MHIWILNHYALSPGSAGGTRHFDLARRLVARGHLVTLIVAGVEYLQQAQARLPVGLLCDEENVDGVRLVRVRTRPYQGNGAGRFLNMVDYATHAWQCAPRLEPPDVIVGSTIHHFAGLAAWALARRYRVPFVFEVRDIWPDTLVDMGLSRWHPAVLVFSALDRFLLPRANRVISLLPLATERLLAGGGRRERITIIPNGVDWSRVATVAPPSPVEGRPFMVMYVGAHGPANGLDVVLRAARLVQAQAGAGVVRWVLVGNGPAKPELQALAQAWELTDVEFRDPVPKAQTVGLMQTADAFVFHLRGLAVLSRFGISPNKLWDYLALARPVVFACDSPNNPVADAQAGLSVPPEDPAALAAAVLDLMQRPLAERLRMGEAGRAYVFERHNWDHLSEEFLQLLQEVCQEAGQS